MPLFPDRDRVSTADENNLRSPRLERSRVRRSWVERTNLRNVLTMLAGAVIAAANVAPGMAQKPCNPAIDGTYCASQGKLDLSLPPQPNFQPIQSLGGDLTTPQTQPGTFGAITFQSDGTRCVGLFRRSECR
jgi:hypothetical protein